MKFHASRLGPKIGRFWSEVQGNFAITTALLMPVLIAVAGGAVDVANALLQKTELQQHLDAGVLAAVSRS